MGLPSPPVYNLLANRWIAPRTPLSGAADNLNVPVQLYITPYVQQTLVTFSTTGFYLTTFIKMAPGTFVNNRNDIWECPAASGLYYIMAYKEIFYTNFASEFEGLLVFQCNNNGAVPRTY